MSTEAPKTYKRQELWEAAYRANPYLAEKPESHLIERFCYLMESYTTLTETGQLGMEVAEKRLTIWHLSRLCHLFMEFGSRGGVPAGMQPILPKLTHPEIPKGVLAYRARQRSEPGQLFKFSKRKWLDLMLQGSIHFSPASSYRDSSLNRAIQDDELGFTYYPGKNGPKLEKLPHPPGTDWVEMRHPSDYYVQCLSLRFAPRLFDDFEADSCLVIYDGNEFGQRLMAALKAKFPGWFVTAFGMTYLDPDDPGDQPILVPRIKHMQYIYQQEQRILCHPRVAVQKLEPTTLEVGSLTEIAEIISI